MKFVLVAVVFLLTYPAGRFAKVRPTLQAVFAMFVGFLPFVGIDQLDIDFWGVEHYRGESAGFEITLTDFAVLALYFSLPDERHGPVPWRFPRYFYMAVLLFSIGAAAMPLYSWFSVWKLVRAYFLFAVVFRAIESNPRIASWLADGFGVGLLYALGVSLHQRYVEGLYQATGDFDHQNTLGMTVNLVFPIAWAVVLAGQSRIWGTILTIVGGVLVVMTLSRGTLALYSLAAGIVLVGTFFRGVTRWKLVVLGLMVVAGCVVLAKSHDSIIDRFTQAPEGSELARERFNGAAAAMLDDHPLGIGINQYSHVLEHHGYAEEFGMPEIDKDAVAHHIYWLTLAELGWVGLVAYVLLLFAVWWTALKGTLRMRGDIRGDVILGCFAGLTAMYVHGNFEWVARQTPMTYLFFAVAGMTAALYKQWSQEQRVGEAVEEAAIAALERKRPKEATRIEAVEPP